MKPKNPAPNQPKPIDPLKPIIPIQPINPIPRDDIQQKWSEPPKNEK
jgi:hypothetical protein